MRWLRIAGHRAAGIFIVFYGRVQKSWNQFDEYDSPKIRAAPAPVVEYIAPLCLTLLLQQLMCTLRLLRQ